MLFCKFPTARSQMRAGGRARRASQNTHLLIERRRYRQLPTFLLLLPPQIRWT